VVSPVVKNGDFGYSMLQKISELEQKYGIRLGLAQKILLAETGTVEQVLSILSGSPIRVNVVQQRENAKTIHRRSVIINDADEVLIRAYSKIFLGNLPKKIAQQVKQKQLGIGSIICSSSLETFRKIIEVGYDPVNKLVFRRYHVIYRKKIVFEIKEELIGM
jgi:chorismate-pyruvate lyase